MSTSTSTFATITGTVTGPIGQPISGILCYLDMGNTGTFANTYPYHALSDANGAISFGNLPPGTYKVRQFKASLDALGLKQVTPDCSQWAMKGVDVTLAAGQSATTTFVNAPVGQPIPVPPPASTAKPLFGFNIDAAWNTSLIIAGCKQFNAGIVRYFPGGGFDVSAVPGLLDPVARYAPALKSVVVLNFNEPGNLIPTIPRLTAFLNAIPPASQTSIIAFEFGNEVDMKSVFSDTPANYAAAIKVVYQILVVEKGYKLIISNVTTWGAGSSGQSFYEAIAALGVFALKGIYAGLHAYTNTGAGAIAYHKDCKGWVEASGASYWCTELGLHCDPNNLPAWAKEDAILVAWAYVTINALYFPLMPTNTGAGPQAVFDAKGQPNQPFYDAVKGAMGI